MESRKNKAIVDFSINEKGSVIAVLLEDARVLVYKWLKCNEPVESQYEEVLKVLEHENIKTVVCDAYLAQVRGLADYCLKNGYYIIPNRFKASAIEAPLKKIIDNGPEPGLCVTCFYKLGVKWPETKPVAHQKLQTA